MTTDYSDIMTINSEDSVRRMHVKNMVLGKCIRFRYKDGIYEMNGNNVLLKKVLVENGSFEIPSFVTSLHDDNKYVSPFIDCVSLKVTNKSEITDFKRLFAESRIKELDLSEFDASKAESLESFLMDCKELHTVNLTGFTTSNRLKFMSFFFRGCNHITSLDLNSLTTDHVTDFSYMFEGCNRLSEFVLTPNSALINSICFQAGNYLPLNIKNGLMFNYMFSGTKALKKLSLGGCKDAFVVEGMFKNSNIKMLDMRYFKLTTNVLSIEDIFAGCKYLSKVYVTDPTLEKAIDNR